MASGARVYVAGVGVSPSPPKRSPEHIVASLVSAATKALLDAGITFDDVTQGVHSLKGQQRGHGAEAFKAFDEGGVTVDEVEIGSELKVPFELVKNQNAQCVLTIAVENSSAIAIVLISERFLWRRPYLRDSAALIDEHTSTSSKSTNQAAKGLYNICKIVWALRGWSQSRDTIGKGENIPCEALSGSAFQLKRADGIASPEWKEVEYRQDGKYRLGYNPAVETVEISHEDFEAVAAVGKASNDRKGRTLFDRKGGDRAALAKL